VDRAVCACFTDITDDDVERVGVSDVNCASDMARRIARSSATIH
jgi:hypothetical protein